MNADDATDAGTASSDRRIPGEEGVWILVFGDLFVFAVFFGTFAYYRLLEPAVFATSQATLNQSLGLLNTLLLLTSSFFVIRAVEAGRKGKAKTGRVWTSAAMLLGASFLVVKILEYRQKVAAGHLPSSDNFFMLYFAFTGIHAVHVLVGLAVLGLLRARLEGAVAGRDHIVESCGLYWHMVDVLWVILFAIFYLHR